MEAMKLERKPAFHSPGPYRYWHPNGWVIYKAERDWDLRGMTRGAAHQWSPKRWWEVKRGFSSSRRRETFMTLREARAWCDENKPDA